MLNRIVLVALIAGGVAGLAVSVLQHWAVVPLILKAESYERAPLHHHGAAAPTGVDGPAAAEEPPYSGLSRIAVTTISTIGAAVGFALMLLALMNAAGERISTSAGLAWGAAAFAAAGLAPAMGLAPQLPGASEAAVQARQLWWGLTVAASAGGLWLLLRHRAAWAMAAGAVLLLIPHLIGAPQAGEFTSAAPAELAAAFTARSLGLQGVLWLSLAALAGYTWQRLEARSPLGQAQGQ